MEFTSLKYVALTIGFILAFLIKKKYPDFPSGKKQVAILAIGLIIASIFVFMNFIS